jgi:hypothetical protein
MILGVDQKSTLYPFLMFGKRIAINEKRVKFEDTETIAVI